MMNPAEISLQDAFSDERHHALMAVTQTVPREIRAAHARAAKLISEYGKNVTRLDPDFSAAAGDLLRQLATIREHNGHAEEAAACAQASERYTRWIGVPTRTDKVPEEYRDDCGTVRRAIERIADTSCGTRKYLETVPGLSDDVKRQLIQIRELTNAGVHYSETVPVADMAAAMKFVVGIERARDKVRGSWRAPLAPFPSAFCDTRNMKSCLVRH